MPAININWKLYEILTQVIDKRVEWFNDWSLSIERSCEITELKIVRNYNKSQEKITKIKWEVWNWMIIG